MDPTLRPRPNTGQRPPASNTDLLDELRAIRREQSRLRELFDSFAGVYLNAKFPYGKADDRWARRR